MKLFNVHCGYYDRETGDGVFESHCNLFIAAEDFAQAKAKAKNDPRFKAKRMHVDGIQELKQIDGYSIELVPSESAETEIPTLGYKQIQDMEKTPQLEWETSPSTH